MQEEGNKLIEVYRGCLIGGAIGDALGYPVEFMKLPKIANKFGKNGITDLVLSKETNKRKKNRKGA